MQVVAFIDMDCLQQFLWPAVAMTGEDPAVPSPFG